MSFSTKDTTTSPVELAPGLFSDSGSSVEEVPRLQLGFLAPAIDEPAPDENYNSDEELFHTLRGWMADQAAEPAAVLENASFGETQGSLVDLGVEDPFWQPDAECIHFDSGNTAESGDGGEGLAIGDFQDLDTLEVPENISDMAFTANVEPLAETAPALDAVTPLDPPAAGNDDFVLTFPPSWQSSEELSAMVSAFSPPPSSSPSSSYPAATAASSSFSHSGQVTALPPTLSPPTSTSSPTPARTGAFPPFPRRFRSGAEARQHRRSSREPPKTDPNISAVKANRDHWVQKIYEAMIDVTAIQDCANSPHRKRFMQGVWDPLDLEATAHHVFEKVLAVHEQGWARPMLYHKKAVRGDRMDTAGNDAGKRLQLVCEVLRTNKAACNDAIQGGITLARLVYNPKMVELTKAGNNTANQDRGKRLKLGKEAELREREKGKGKEVVVEE
ncbi:hypothetical protein M011DRAFT_482139 [Sporormia fimetaria CBS 119925]|uniref:Uncharacterized protein n=1 Tax=Sporormia fimetaria CBS 119925 TaxID=1340428 RepID=A0A6A6UXS8_9PLEO|nr:hypothetical protein M011DRAFT_482139 [Sporormia fimetaria CBS 119925]